MKSYMQRGFKLYFSLSSNYSKAVYSNLASITEDQLAFIYIVYDRNSLSTAQYQIPSEFQTIPFLFLFDTIIPSEYQIYRISNTISEYQTNTFLNDNPNARENSPVTENLRGQKSGMVGCMTALDQSKDLWHFRMP